MQKQYRIFFTFIGLICASVTHAENMLVDVNVLYTIPDAGATDDFRTGKILSVNYNYYTLPWLALTTGIFISEEISENANSDIVGTFQTRIETSGITLGLRPEHAFSDRNKIYGRAGLLFYKTKLSVEDYFEPGIPGGTTSASTDGNGYILALGWAHYFTPKVTFQLELKTQQHLDLFDGKTNADNVFDISYSGFSIGLGYAF